MLLILKNFVVLVVAVALSACASLGSDGPSTAGRSTTNVEELSQPSPIRPDLSIFQVLVEPPLSMKTKLLCDELRPCLLKGLHYAESLGRLRHRYFVEVNTPGSSEMIRVYYQLQGKTLFRSISNNLEKIEPGIVPEPGWIQTLDRKADGRPLCEVRYAVGFERPLVQNSLFRAKCEELYYSLHKNDDETVFTVYRIGPRSLAGELVNLTFAERVGAIPPNDLSLEVEIFQLVLSQRF